MNVLDLVKNKGLSFKRMSSTKGDEYACACPDCGGNDRFRIWPESNKGRGGYWCRRCGKHGDNIQFLIDFDGSTFKEACKALDIQCTKTSTGWRAPGSTCPGSFMQEVFKPMSATMPGVIWQQKALAFIDHAEKQLAANDKALQVLIGRGLSLDTIKAARLGWNPCDMYRPRAAWGLEVNQTEDKPRRLWLPGGHIIPCFAGDDVMRLRVRRAEGDPRYVIISGSGNAPMICGTGQHALVVVESELDAVLVAQEAGDIITVAAMGSVSSKPDIKLHELLQTMPLVLVAFDYDKAGASAWPWWQKHYCKATVWPVADGKDPTEAFKRGMSIRAWIKAGVPVCAILDAARAADRAEIEVEDVQSPYECRGCYAEINGLCIERADMPPCSAAIKTCKYRENSTHALL